MVYLKKLLEERQYCPNRYQDYVNVSNYCYRIVTDDDTWEGAKLKCKEDGGELACFSNHQERDTIADKCDHCWVGYTWKHGKFPTVNNVIVLVSS